jgi:hypothetical protein
MRILENAALWKFYTSTSNKMLEKYGPVGPVALAGILNRLGRARA